MEVGIEIHVFLYGEIFIKTEFLWHVAEFVLHCLRLFGNIFAENGKASLSRKHKPCHKAHERRFSGAVRAYKSREHPFLYFNVKGRKCCDGGSVLLRKDLRKIFSFYNVISLCVHQRSTRTVAGIPRRRMFSGSSR